MPRTAIDPRTRDRARRLRRDLADAERHFWRLYPSFRVHGARLGRQASIGPRIADGAWLSASFVVDVDAGRLAGERRGHHCVRDTRPNSAGFDVVRFWHRELTDILHAVRDRPINMIVEHSADPTPPAVPAVDLPREGKGDGLRSISIAGEA